MTEQLSLGFPGASVVKNLPAMQELQEAWVRSLGQEDPLEEEIATHSNILTWKIPWTEEPGRLQSLGSKRVGHNLATNTYTWKGTPLCVGDLLHF